MMSISLMAYPMAFLIEPEKTKDINVSVKENNANSKKENVIIENNLIFISANTNIECAEMSNIISSLNLHKIDNTEVYMSDLGLLISFERIGKFLKFKFSGDMPVSKLQKYCESFFSDLDTILKRNVRLINGYETFFYTYSTNYIDVKDIYKALKTADANNIYQTSDAIIAELNGQNLRYYKNGENKYLLEVQQKIEIVNIGIDSNISSSINNNFTELKFKTNIKREELIDLIKKINYVYIPANGEMYLKNSYATLNWVFEDGYYTALFSGVNQAAIVKEADIIFRQLNIFAGRDVRFINDTSVTTYTYNTNYTDRSILLETLAEHGATNISEDNNIIICQILGMKMKYIKNANNSYSLEITQVSDKKECETTIFDLNEEYGLKVQEATYNKLKAQLENENYTLESEEVLEDDSILLTIEV